MTKRTLSLKSERLVEIGPADLAAVAGAADQLSGLTCPALDCLSQHGTCDITFQPRCF